MEGRTDGQTHKIIIGYTTKVGLGLSVDFSSGCAIMVKNFNENVCILTWYFNLWILITSEKHKLHSLFQLLGFIITYKFK